MKLKLKVPLFFLVTTIVPILVVGIFSVSILQRILIEGTVERLTTAAELQVERVEELLDRYLEWAELVASRTRMRTLTRTYQETGDPSLIPELEAIISDAALSIHEVDDVIILDRDGVVVASVRGEYASQDFVGTDAFVQAQENAYFDGIVKNENNQLQVQMSAPLFVEDEFIGVAVVIAEASGLIHILTNYEGLGETGEVLLARANAAGDAVFLAPIRFDAGAALVRAVSADSLNVPIIQALQANESFFEDANDYRGQQVIAVTRYIPAPEWGLVAKIDRVEVFNRLIGLIARTVIALITAYIAMVILWIIFSRRAVKALKQLAEAAKHIRSDRFESHLPTHHENDEIGMLADSLKETGVELRGLYKNLEERVKSRTEQLQSTMGRIEENNAALVSSKLAMENLLEDLDSEKASLQKAKARDEAILASMGDGLVVLNAKHEVMLMNPVAEQLMLLKQAEAYQKSWPAVLGEGPIKNEDGKILMEEQFPRVEAMKDGKPVTRNDLSFRRTDGEYIPVTITVSPIRGDDGHVGTVIILRDTTLERQVDKAKTEFVSLASHQLRTPLSTINWYAELLLNGDAGQLTAEQKQFIEEMYHGNQRMVDLVNALLNVSRIELGTFMVEPEPVDAVALVKQIVHDLEVQINERKHTVDVKVENQIPTMQLDPKLFRIVIENLLTNAIKYTPEGGQIDLNLARHGDAKHQRFHFTIADNGMGIPKDQQDKIFSKLFRADNVRESDTRGTGLGLYILKSIVEQSHGTVSFESEEGKGTTFHIDIPIQGMVKRKGTKTLD